MTDARAKDEARTQWAQRQQERGKKLQQATGQDMIGLSVTKQEMAAMLAYVCAAVQGEADACKAKTETMCTLERMTAKHALPCKDLSRHHRDTLALEVVKRFDVAVRCRDGK